MKLTYNPGVFDVGDVGAAMSIILTPDGESTDARWRRETPYLTSLIAQHTGIGEHSTVLDFGCGIGRMSRALVTAHGCRAVGVDISTSMRGLAPGYVESDRFLCCAPEALDWMVGQGVRCDVAFAVWVLQHCPDLRGEIARIAAALRPQGLLFVANTLFRCVPSVEQGWVNDGADLRELLGERFDLREEGQLDPGHVAPLLSQNSFWAVYQAR
jgi:SAM-dependent methyltransferase